jgi:NADH:ubiquinone oxidoreductase subunit D
MGYVGSFHGFANPRTADEMAAAMPVLTSPAPGAALDSAGSVKGTISYTVTSNGTPDPSRLPGQVPSDTHISANIKTLFGDQNATVTPVTGSYTFTYHQIEGQDYTQVG